jgi:hypothetical protein
MSGYDYGGRKIKLFWCRSVINLCKFNAICLTKIILEARRKILSSYRKKSGKSDEIADGMIVVVGVQHANECSKQEGRDD